MNRDFSLIDASVARAKGGLRVLDEVARFILRDAGAFAELKALRHGLTDVGLCFGVGRCVNARSGLDIGAGEVVKSEYARSSLWSIIRANAGRATESVRALEEFAKVYAPEVVKQLETMRYKVYNIEKELLMQTPHFWLNKYFEEGIVYPISDSFEEVVWLVENGAKVIQLRDKQSSKAEILNKAKKICLFLSHHNRQSQEKVLFIINDDVELAALLPVAGVHLGQANELVNEARQRVGTNKIIGTSNHSFDDVARSVQSGADYISIGPIFATPTKPDRAPVGLDLIRKAKSEIIMPTVAIGGINKNNLREVKEAGAKNVAVIRSAKEFFS